ncbi:hypothetical protein SAY86_005065 [Trapa natans]|uniref:RRM domain-containing protein n=1 Tax=Trapa natans TaxID=22666 RepID=A0AAN7L8F1_TRANT|nr:hypothetical protein SAY86_005065 [Trapa natans]
MSRLGKHRENLISKADRMRDNKDEGSAARTRPFSFEEIMKRRKHKELSHFVKEEVKVVEFVPKTNAIPDPIRGGRETKRLSSIIERPALEETVRVSNRGGEENHHIKEEKPIRGISGGSKYPEEVSYKEVHGSLKEGIHAKGNRSRESAAELRSNSISEVWNRDNRGETTKKLHSRNQNGEWYRGAIQDRRLRSEITNVGDRNDAKQKIHARGMNIEPPRSYRVDRVQRNELRNRGSRGETDKNNRNKKDEWPRNNVENKGPSKGQYESHKRMHMSKDDEWSRNNSDDRAHKAYSRDSLVDERSADRSMGKLEKETKRKHQTADNRDSREKNPIQRSDMGRSSHSEVPRKRKKELPGSRHEETIMKRKRSRSQDQFKNRERSVSLSPEAHKRTSFNGKKLGDTLSGTPKDRTEKQQKDVERSKFSGNGSSNYYRGPSGLTSGLGGYSPRKRKNENDVKTPSPANRSPERKRAGWDIPATEVKDSTNTVTQVSQLSNHQAVPLDVHELVSAVTAALNASNPLPGASGILPGKDNTSIDSIQLTESTRPMRRLYVENTPGSASEKDVMEYLNNRLLSSGVNCIQGRQPCISCIIHKEKHQALVEFLTPEDASAALSFDGSSFYGSVLKIRRPKDFVEVTTGNTVEAARLAVAVPLSNVVKDSPHKIFVGGISEALSPEMLIEIASAFGQLKAFYIDATQDTLYQYAFLEYLDHSVTTKACAGLNGMKLGGQVLTVVQALPYSSPMKISERQPTYVIPSQAKPLLQKPTEVIKLINVFTVENMFSLSKLEIEEVLEDVRLECTRFGTVKSLNVVEQETLLFNDSEETCGDHNNDEFAEDEENPGQVGNIFSATSGVVNTATEEFREAKVEGGTDEKLEQDYALEPQVISFEENINEIIIDEDHALGQPFDKVDLYNPATDLPSPDSPNQPKSFVDHSEYLESKESDRQIEGVDDPLEPSCNEELNSVEGKPSSRGATTGLGFSENEEIKEPNSEIRHIFELGSIFVEYKRTEVSCTAAHALHGRLFDERAVMVEFVPLDLYQARFPR